MNNEDKKVEPSVRVFGEEVAGGERCRHHKKCCHHHHQNVVGGLLFLSAGIMLLLNTLGAVPWEFWRTLVPFWPVLLILCGLQIVLGHSFLARIIMMVITIVTFISITAYGLQQVGSPAAQYVHPTFPEIINSLPINQQ